MAQKKIVDTAAYVATHGMTPRTWPGQGASQWAVQLDDNPTPVRLYGKYPLVIKRAKELAQFRVTVCP